MSEPPKEVCLLGEPYECTWSADEIHPDLRPMGPYVLKSEADARCAQLATEIINLKADRGELRAALREIVEALEDLRPYEQELIVKYYPSVREALRRAMKVLEKTK